MMQLLFAVCRHANRLIKVLSKAVVNGNKKDGQLSVDKPNNQQISATVQFTTGR